MMIVPFMPQIGSYCNNHLIINVCVFLRLGVKAGKDSLPFAILRKKIMSQQKVFGTLCSRL